MYDYSRGTPYVDYRTDVGLADRPAVLGKVMGLLGFAFLFTAGGAVIGLSLGPGAFLLSIVGSFATVIALQFLRDRSPLNLALLYAFATFEGMALGLILEAYVAQGLGGAVFNAAATTAAVTLAAGAYGYTPKRDLSGLGGILLVGLMGGVVASVVGMFVQLPLLYMGISAVPATLFTGYIALNRNRVQTSR